MAKKKSESTVSWAHAVRDIVVASINKGQLPILGIFAIIMLLIYKLPTSDVMVLIKAIGEKLRNGEMVSYPLLVVVMLGWYFHARYTRKYHSEEYKRIGREKSELQSLLGEKKFISSEKKI